MSTFDLTPEFEYKTTQNFSTVQTPFESGAVQLRARWAKPIRKWTLIWKHATPDEAEELRAFYRDHYGPADTFDYVPVEYVARPFVAPTLGQTASGSQGYRWRNAAYTWSDGSNETQESLEATGLYVSNGYALTVTVPEFPTGVDRAYVYVGTSVATLAKQAVPIQTSGGTWTEPMDTDEGYDENGASVPSSNTLSETVTAHFVDDSLSVIKLNAYTYSMQVELAEILTT